MREVKKLETYKFIPLNYITLRTACVSMQKLPPSFLPNLRKFLSITITILKISDNYLPKVSGQ